MLYKYNDRQWFNTDCIETVDDFGFDIGVKLKGGRDVRIHGSGRESFLKLLHQITSPKFMVVPKGAYVFGDDYGAGEIVPVDPATLRPL